MSTYYQILGVSKFAEASEIKRAFRQKAKDLHPDVNNNFGAQVQFQRINEAYQVLKDPMKRRMYDARLVSGFPVQPVYYRPSGKVKYRARGDKYAHYATRSKAEIRLEAMEKYIDLGLLVFMSCTGIFSIFYGLYRLFINPVEYINPFSGLINGSIIFGTIIVFLLYRKKHTKD